MDHPDIILGRGEQKEIVNDKYMICNVITWYVINENNKYMICIVITLHVINVLH